jgi:transposase
MSSRSQASRAAAACQALFIASEVDGPQAAHRGGHGRAAAGRGDHRRLGPDRDGARPLLWNLHRACRRVCLVWADVGYTGKLAAWASALPMNVRVVAKRDPHAFEILPRRWVVERTLAWISKHRRTVRDYEQLPASHEAMILWAMIALRTRRLAPSADLSDAH